MLLALCTLLHADVYDLNDAGVTLDLPKGWAPSVWTDYELRATNAEGNVALLVWYEAFQPVVDEDTVKSWAARYRTRIEAEKVKNVRMESAVVAEVGSRATGRVEMRFNFDRVGAKGVMYAAGFAGEGKTLHVATYGDAGVAAKVEQGLEVVLDRLKLDKPPMALPEGPLKGVPGVEVVLPAGWRGYLPGKEAEAVSSLVALTGEYDEKLCVRGARPNVDSTGSVIVICQRSWQLGLFDEASATDVEKSIRTLLYGKAADKVPVGSTIELPDRLGIALSPEANKYDLRTLVVPYDQGWLVGTAVGQQGTGDQIGDALRATFTSLSYSGPDDGKPAWSTGQQALHLLSYKPWHPAVLVPLFFVMGAFALVVRVVLRKPAAPADSY